MKLTVKHTKNTYIWPLIIRWARDSDVARVKSYFEIFWNQINMLLIVLSKISFKIGKHVIKEIFKRRTTRTLHWYSIIYNHSSKISTIGTFWPVMPSGPGTSSLYSLNWAVNFGFFLLSFNFSVLFCEHGDASSVRYPLVDKNEVYDMKSELLKDIIDLINSWNPLYFGYVREWREVTASTFSTKLKSKMLSVYLWWTLV